MLSGVVDFNPKDIAWSQCATRCRKVNNVVCRGSTLATGSILILYHYLNFFSQIFIVPLQTNFILQCLKGG